MIISPRKPESRLKSDLESQIIADTFKSIIFNNINFYIFVTNFLWQIEPSLWTFFVVFTIVSANLRRKIMELCNKLTMEPDKIHCTYTRTHSARYSAKCRGCVTESATKYEKDTANMDNSRGWLRDVLPFTDDADQGGGIPGSHLRPNPQSRKP